MGRVEQPPPAKNPAPVVYVEKATFIRKALQRVRFELGAIFAKRRLATCYLLHSDLHRACCTATTGTALLLELLAKRLRSACD